MHEIPSSPKIITRSTCSYSCGQSRSWPCPPCGSNTWQCWTEIQFHSICSKPMNIEDNRLILGQPQPLLHHPAKIWRWHFSKIWFYTRQHLWRSQHEDYQPANTQHTVGSCVSHPHLQMKTSLTEKNYSHFETSPTILTPNLSPLARKFTTAPLTFAACT